MTREEDQRMSEVVRRERSRLYGFIRGRVPDPRDAEEIPLGTLLSGDFRAKEAHMRRVTGIGGIFFKAQNPAA